MSERFLVTGALGCIGAWILRQLVDEGVAVVAADASADDHRVAALLGPDERDGIAFVRADVSRPDEVRALFEHCLLYTSPSPRDLSTSRMPSSA